MHLEILFQIAWDTLCKNTIYKMGEGVNGDWYYTSPPKYFEDRLDSTTEINWCVPIKCKHHEMSSVL